MSRHITALIALFLLAPALSGQPMDGQGAGQRPAVLYEGARLISGTGAPPVGESAFLVENDTITRVGRKGEVTAPAGAARVDLTGKTVMPVLIDAHGHPGFQKGLSYVQENFTRETIINDLNRALYFGFGAVQSQGIEQGDLTYQIRADQEAGKLGGARLLIAGRGLGAPNAGPGADTYRNIAYEVTTEEEARRNVRELVAKKVNLIKIWVDDRNGRAPRLSQALYRAIIDEGHKHGLRVNAHVFYHTDAVDLVEAGIDGVAHLVRDKEMDAALVASIVKHNVYVMANMSGTERATYAELPPWLKDGDPLMKLIGEAVPPEVIQRLRNSFAKRDPAAVERSRAQFAILQRSLAKLSAAGARLIVGGDTGLQDHLFGVAEQRELEVMVRAGMTPAQGIVAATSRPAEYLKLDKMGSLAPGKDASFLVLDANPLDDIANTRRIAKMYVKGNEIDRAALSASLKKMTR
jgi:imidazolonepropionase-like amidohydrolase